MASTLTPEEVKKRRLEVITSPHSCLAIADHCECDECFENEECAFAFDPYNWNDPGQFCLAEK